jgi:glucose-6-phosphate isomerase
VRKAFFNSSYQENAPYQIAKVLFELYQKGKFIQILMPYSNRLSKLADWYKQLLAESIGKEKNRAGETVNIGITPVNALGVTDQHSQTQLYNAGPNDKILTYLVAENMGPKIAIPNMKPYHFGELAQIEQKATAQALNEYQKPNFKITIEQIDENNLGQLFFLFESTIALLGEMFKINAYDQPGVELSKDLTRKALAK